MVAAEAIALDPGVDAIRVEWSRDGLRALREGSGRGQESPWRLASDPDWSEIDSLRVVSAAFEDGQMLALVAVLPAGAEGHDATRRRCALVDAQGEVTETVETLLSTEYDAGGEPTRIGLELYTEADAPPMRVAADRSGPASEAGGGRAYPMTFRMEGFEGAGILELVKPS